MLAREIRRRGKNKVGFSFYLFFNDNGNLINKKEMTTLISL